MRVINDFFIHANPASSQFEETAKKYGTLTLAERVLAVALAVLAGLATCFAGGALGVYVFSKCVQHFSQKGEAKEEGAGTQKIGFQEIASAHGTPAFPPPSLEEAEHLPLGELMLRAVECKRESKTLGVSKAEAEACHAILTSEENKIQHKLNFRLSSHIFSLATSKNVSFPEKYLENLRAELQPFLDQYCNSPFKFLNFVHIAAIYLTDLNHFPLYAWEVLNLLKWPSEELKAEHLQPMVQSIFESANSGFKFDEWKVFMKEGVFLQPFPLNVAKEIEFLPDFQKLIEKLGAPCVIPSEILNISQQDADEHQSQATEQLKFLEKMISASLTVYVGHFLGPAIDLEINKLLKPFIGEPVLFIYLCDEIAKNLFDEGCCLLEVMEILSRLEWPDQELKEEQIEDICYDYLRNVGVGEEVALHKTGLTVFELSLLMKKLMVPHHGIAISGGIYDDFCSLLQLCIAKKGSELFGSTAAQDAGVLGIKIKAGTEWGACLPSSSILPKLIKQLKYFPELISLDFREEGTGYEFGTCHGFGDGLADDLIELIKQQPKLIEIVINDQAMAKETKKRFWQKANRIFEKRIDKLKKANIDSKEIWDIFG